MKLQDSNTGSKKLPVSSVRELVGFGGSDVNDLTMEQRTLFDLMVLVVDIKYRQRYGKTLETQHAKGYAAIEQETDDD